jgi:hypothetical protein
MFKVQLYNYYYSVTVKFVIFKRRGNIYSDIHHLGDDHQLKNC